MHTRIAIILLPNFNMHATTAFIDPFRVTNYLHNEGLYSWDFISLDAQLVPASNGMELKVDKTLRECEGRYDLVFVSASWAPEQYNDRQLIRYLRSQYQQGATLGGLDTGGQILAYAELTKQRQVTVHYEHIASMRELFPHTHTCEELFVIDDRIATCCGGQASSDLALTLIYNTLGVDMANSAARYIFHDRMRNASDSQLPNYYEPIGYAAPSKLRQAIVQMESNLEHTLSIKDVAHSIGVSQRQLARLFKDHTGVSPVQYYVEVRLDRAHGMITQTQLPILSIAVACGFNSQEHFCKAYKKRFGCAPTADRKRGRTPFHFRSFPAPHG